MQNILENPELGYTPKKYDFSDYNLYLYYKELWDCKHFEKIEKYFHDRLTAEADSFSHAKSSLSSLEESGLDSIAIEALKALSARYFERFKILANNNAGFDELLNLGVDIQRQKYLHPDHLLVKLNDIDVSNMQLSEAKDLLESFRASLTEITRNLKKKEMFLIIDEEQNPYAPRIRYFQYLDAAWAELTGHKLASSGNALISDLNNTEDESRRVAALDFLKGFSKAVAETHAHNLQVISSPDFTRRCLAGFETLTPSPQKQTLTSSNNNSFLMCVYQDRRFQHWLCQLVLLAIVITAALVFASLVVKASMLPLAVATVVTGLSKFAANVIFGTAAVVGVAATVALGASLYARFFSQRPPEGGDAGSSATMIHGMKA